MSKLPNADSVIIEQIKLTGYILSTKHPEGRFKAAFFKKYGYQASEWKTLERDIRTIALSHDVTVIDTSSFGTKYVVEGKLKSPSGKTIKICTVWIILEGEDTPRLVTAYAGGRI